MTTPLTITSLSQGTLNAAPKSDAEYWQRFAAKPEPVGSPRGSSSKAEWPHWFLALWAVRS